MPILYSYPQVATLNNGDLITGTQVSLPASSKNPTVCWTVATFSNHIQGEIGSSPAFNDDAAAGLGGLVAGDIYQTTGLGAAPLNAAGIVMIKQ